jgi:hypothetical protein
MSSKISTGPNARPRDASISSTAPGLPDDTSRPVEVDEAEVERMERKLKPDRENARKRELKDAIELPVKGSA